ncbi:hypothetical protein [Oleiharenicola lentus]|uniref:hypothetical protein n=1 Tax=Oleiharenicola lentus TaxID=2508720 RepID=UPI003F6795F5
MKLLRLIFGACAVFGLGACAKKETPTASTASSGHSSHHGHHHEPPHGGTPVILGNEDFHLEFVRDAAAGSLTAYVLDAHMSQFVRLPAPAIELTVKFAGKTEPLTLAALPNLLTGEKIGDTSAFVGTGEWLKTTAEFEAVVTSVTIRGQNYANIAFAFPKGNDADEPAAPVSRD